MFPPELNVLKHRKAVFLFEVTTYNVTNTTSLYSTNKIIEEARIIFELERKIETLVYTLTPIVFNIIYIAN